MGWRNKVDQKTDEVDQKITLLSKKASSVAREMSQKTFADILDELNIAPHFGSNKGGYRKINWNAV